VRSACAEGLDALLLRAAQSMSPPQQLAVTYVTT